MKRAKIAQIMVVTVIALGGLMLLGQLVVSFLPVTDRALVRVPLTPVLAPVSGQIKTLYQANGSQVHVGQAILAIDMPHLQKYLQAAAADRDQAKASAAVARQEAEVARLSVRQAALKLRQAQASAASDAQLSVLRQGLATANGQWALARARVQVAKKIVEAKQLAYKQAQAKLATHIVRAPRAGRLVNLQVAANSSVSQNSQLFAIANPESAIVEAAFSEDDLAQAKAGDKVLIWLRMQGFAPPYHGLLTANWQTLDNQLSLESAPHYWLSPPRRIKVSIQLSPESQLQSWLIDGMSAYAYIQTH